MRRVDHRVRSRGSGCPVHKKQLLPVLVVWAPPRKKRDQERPQWEHVGLGCEILLRDDPGHLVEEAQCRHFRGSTVAWRGRPGPLASHEAQKEDVRKPVAGRPRTASVTPSAARFARGCS